MSNIVKEFKDFINRGNVIDLAVAVVIGGAFATVVTTFTSAILMPIVAAIIGEPDFSQLTFDLGDSRVYYGVFLTALVNFVIIAFAVFLVVKSINEMQNRRSAGDEDDEAAPSDVDLLTEIRDLLASQQGGTPPPTV